MRWALLSLKIPNNWMTNILADNSNKIEKIQVLNCRQYKYRGGTGIIKIISKDNNVTDIMDFINNHENVLKSDFSQLSSKTLIGEIILEKCSACMALNRSKCFMISSRSKSDYIQWTVAGEKNEDIYDLLYYLKTYGCEVQLTKLSSPSDFNITERQKDVLKYAFYKGYFEYPKKIKIEDISRAFNIGKSTVSEILRGGQRAIFAEYFK